MSILRRVMGALGWVKRSAYVAASLSRLTADWISPGGRSADQEIQGDFHRLRARAREQRRNNPLAARFVELATINVIGPVGIQLESTVEHPDGTPNLAARKAVEAAWRAWGRVGVCSTDGRSSWRDVQNLLVEARVVDGEGLLRLHRGRGPWGLELEVLDADQLATDIQREARPGQPAIRYGVEVDETNRPLAYWIHPGHPAEGDGGRASAVRVPAHEIIHLYRQHRPGQTRGVSDLAAGLLPAKMLDGLLEAELVALRTAATKMGFFVRDEASSLYDPSGGTSMRATMEAEPGLMDFLPPGATDFRPWDPQHPTTAFADFARIILRQIASAWGVAYYSLTSDVSDVNYTSSRAAMLQERDRWRDEHQWWIEHLHIPVFLAWLPMAVLSGRLRPPADDWERWAKHSWMPRGWDWTDPVKDLVAAEMSVRLGLDTRSRIAATRGLDFSEILETLRAEADLADSLGLELTSSESAVAVNLNPGQTEV